MLARSQGVCFPRCLRFNRRTPLLCPPPSWGRVSSRSTVGIVPASANTLPLDASLVTPLTARRLPLIPHYVATLHPSRLHARHLLHPARLFRLCLLLTHRLQPIFPLTQHLVNPCPTHKTLILSFSSVLTPPIFTSVSRHRQDLIYMLTYLTVRVLMFTHRAPTLHAHHPLMPLLTLPMWPPYLPTTRLCLLL